ncbi:MAG: hypothetical protein IH830_01960 [Planctomycetes bacterium]|nr:hypothetical protein [Planctomycetota bacterium]
MRLLRRILRRLCAPYRCGLNGPLEVLISQLQVVLGGHWLAVADPLADHVHRELLG